jgi:hypothetical protein
MRLNLEKLISSSCRRKIIESLWKVDSFTIMQLIRKINSTYNQVNSNLLILTSEEIITEEHLGRLRIIRLNRKNPKTTILLQALKMLSANGDKKADMLRLFDRDYKVPVGPPVDVITLLEMPLSLRKTVVALYRFEKATADQIAEVTGRSKAVESECANQMVTMGLINRKQEGRDVYFSIESTLEDEKEENF